MLIVEDHALTASLLADLLAGAFPGHETLIAGSGEESLDIVRARAPQLVIMDIALPGMNGIEATRQIKKLAPGTRVIMRSTYDMPEYREQAAAAGASDYLSKSMDGEATIAAIAKQLSDP